MSNYSHLYPKKVNWKNLINELSECELLIIAAGFEDRALHLFEKIWCPEIRKLAIIKYSHLSENETAFEKVSVFLENKTEDQLVLTTYLDSNLPGQFEKNFEALLKNFTLNPTTGKIWVDVSGIPTFAICMLLRICRHNYPLKEVVIFYTEAKEYFPTESEYTKYLKEYGDSGLERLPASLTTEMSENLIIDSFSGYTIKKDPTCLILYAGYEKHRSIGVIENINPAKLVILYGKPGKIELSWRLNMSIQLHKTLLSETIRAEEIVSTFDIAANLKLLIQYYEFLYDDHNICIAPICSKLQTIATYLMWERFKDIQLVFPLPVKYLPKRFSRECGNTFYLQLPLPLGLEIYKK